MPSSRQNVAQDLVFDVGAANGDDSAYYLRKGFRVVAVEPNPRSVSALRDRFAAEIAGERLSLLPAAISTDEGEAQFWVCDDMPGWSSFDRAIASYCQRRHHDVCVRTCRFSTLIEQFGVPFYCKIDIEGCDRLCLEQMCEDTAPPFVSIELPTNGSAPKKAVTKRMMDRLERLGYGRFKVISQVTFRQPGKFLPGFKARLPAALSRRITQLDQALRKYAADEDWRFGEDSSGPFGENSRGAWLSADEARRRIAIIQRNRDISEWYDLHAALPEAA